MLVIVDQISVKSNEQLITGSSGKSIWGVLGHKFYFKPC